LKNKIMIYFLILLITIIPYSNVVLAEDNQLSEEDLPTPVLQVDFDDGTVTDKSPSEIEAEVVGNPTYVRGVNGGQAIYFENPDDDTETAEQYVNFGQPEALQFGTDNFTTV